MGSGEGGGVGDLESEGGKGVVMELLNKVEGVGREARRNKDR